MDMHSGSLGYPLWGKKYLESDSRMLRPCVGSAFLSTNATVIFPSNTSLLGSWQREECPTRQTVHWNNLVKISEVDKPTFQTFFTCAISLNDLRGYSVFLTASVTSYTSLWFKPAWSFLGLSAKDSVGGSLTTLILKCLLTLETKTSSHSLSTDVFYCSKKLNYLKHAKLLLRSFTLRFIVLEWSASSVPENRFPFVVKYY